MNERVKVAHLISGDLWAGAEAQAFTLLSELQRAREFELLAILMNEGALASKLRSVGVRVVVIEEARTGSFRIFLRLRRLLAAEGIAILHTHRYKENILGSLAAVFSTRPRLVQTVHGLPESFGLSRRAKISAYHALDRLMARLFFDRIIGVSKHIAFGLEREFGKGRTVCIHNGVDTNLSAGRQSRDVVRQGLGIAATAPLVVTAGRLVPVKGFDQLLRAAVVMGLQLPDIRVLIAGGGPEKDALCALANELGIEEAVIMTDHREDVLDLIAAADLFVLPSLAEGVPMVLLEATALEIPILATRVGGIPEILEDQVTAVLVEPSDPRALADAALQLLGHRESARRMAEAALRRLNDNFSARAMAQKVTDLYRSLSA